MNDRGSGTVLAVAVIGCLTALAIAALPLYMAVAVSRSVAAAADAAALAAADAAVGIVTGYPCERAAQLVEANGSFLATCETDGLVVTVVASRSLLGFAVTAAATAGPPPGEAD